MAYMVGIGWSDCYRLTTREFSQKDHFWPTLESGDLFPSLYDVEWPIRLWEWGNTIQGTASAAKTDSFRVEAVRPPDSHTLEEWRRTAEQGDTNAQMHLGVAYYEGKVVAQDYSQSAKWYRKAAEQDEGVAEFALGTAYLDGIGVPKDSIMAYMWLNLAAAHNGEGVLSAAPLERDKLEKMMTPVQIAEAQRLSREWQSSHAK